MGVNTHVDRKQEFIGSKRVAAQYILTSNT